MKRICLFTASGAENLGDELITYSEIQVLRERIPGCEIILFSHAPERTRRFLMSQCCTLDGLYIFEYFPNFLRKKPIKNIGLFFQTIKCIFSSNVVCIGGGGLFYGKNEEGHSPLRSFWLRVSLSKILRKKIYYLSLGVSADNAELKPFSRTLFEGITITVRDTMSKETLLKLGYYSKILPDPVFNYKPLAASEERNKKLIGIALRKGYLPDKVFLGLLRDLVSRGYDVILLPHSLHPTHENSHDGYYLQDFLLPGIQIAQTIEETLKCYKKCHIIIAMRLHSMILSAVHAIPFVGLMYGKKTQTLLHEMNWSQSLDPKNCTKEDILKSLDQVLENHSSLSKELVKFFHRKKEEYDSVIKKIIF